MPAKVAKSLMKAFVMKVIRDEEEARGVGLDYLKWIVENAWPSFKIYRKFSLLGRYRSALPLEAYHWVRILTTELQNVQSCRDVERYLAIKAGLSPQWTDNCMEAAKTRDYTRVGVELHELADLVLGLEDRELDAKAREKVLKRYGPEAFIEIGWVYIACVAFPMLKRLIGKE